LVWTGIDSSTGVEVTNQRQQQRTDQRLYWRLRFTCAGLFSGSSGGIVEDLIFDLTLPSPGQLIGSHQITCLIPFTMLGQ